MPSCLSGALSEFLMAQAGRKALAREGTERKRQEPVPEGDSSAELKHSPHFRAVPCQDLGNHITQSLGKDFHVIL